MEITRNTTETGVGPSDWFTGTVYIDSVAAAAEPSRLNAANVHFTPGARTAWHTHPPRTDDLRHRGRRPLPAPRRSDRGDQARRPRLLRAGRGALARRRSRPLHDAHRDAGGRRRGQPGHLGRARDRRGVRGAPPVKVDGGSGGSRSQAEGEADLPMQPSSAG